MSIALAPKEKEKLMKDMLASAVHFGHRSEKWHPKMKPFIYGKRQGIHIIDLFQTADRLIEACNYLTKATAEGKKILFVSTKQQSLELITESAKKCQMPYVTGKWMAGLLTNFNTIKNRIKYFNQLIEDEKNKEFDKYTKKEANNLRKTIEKLETSLGGVAGLTRHPDILFVIDVVRDKIAIKEARKINIPVVAIVDTNGDPTGINYAIPGNDDSIKSLKFLIEKITEAVMSGRK